MTGLRQEPVAARVLPNGTWEIDTLWSNIGYEVMRGAYGDMFTWGIADPAKVTRLAVENAASIAAMILTTEALVTEKPEEQSAMPAMPGGMDY